MIIRSVIIEQPSDYIFATNFSVLPQHLRRLIEQTCRNITEPPLSPSTAVTSTPIDRTTHIGESTLLYLNTFSVHSLVF